MGNLARRTVEILRQEGRCEATGGPRRGATPLLGRMAAVVLAAGVAAVAAPGAAHAQSIFGALQAPGPAAQQGGRGLLGGLLPPWAADRITDADRSYMGAAEAAAYNAPLRRQVFWQNPQTGHSGSYQVIREGLLPGGTACRELQSSARIGSRTHRSAATICLDRATGYWRLVRSRDLAELDGPGTAAAGPAIRAG